MDNTLVSKHNGGLSQFSRLLLLVFLAGLQLTLSTGSETPQLQDNEGLRCTIAGPDYVTVGVPSSVKCEATCQPKCTFSMSLHGQSAQGHGNVLDFTVQSWVDTLTVECTATDDGTAASVTAVKRIQVLAGPANVTIGGPKLLTESVSHTFSCHAHCRPSCSYSWSLGNGHWIGGQGNVISLTPTQQHDYKVLICKATNSVSGLFVTATQSLSVTRGPSEIQIKGPDVIDIGKKYTFVCSSVCLPSCRYLSSVDSQTVKGNVIEMTLDQPIKSVTLKCEAQNTASRKMATAFKIVQMTEHNVSTRPQQISVVLLVAFTIAAALTT